MKKTAKIDPEKKNKEQIGLVDVFSGLFSDSGNFKLPKKISQHLKVLGFLSIWFSIPFFLLMVWFSSSPLLPEVYNLTPQDSCTAGGGTWDEANEACIDDSDPAEPVEINFVISFDGVIKKPIANQPIFLKLVNNQENSLNTVFNPTSVWQDSQDAHRFHGKMSLTTAYLRDGFTVYIKGPVHLQRKLENFTFRQGIEADFTNKVLLPGDLYLPGSGQNDRVENSDRDYLWSLVVLRDRNANQSEVRVADLDLDGDVDNRDYSLLIDTGIGTQGEE